MVNGGGITNNTVDFGNSWKVGDIPGCSGGVPPDCDFKSLEKEQRTSKKGCGLMLDKKGPFRECHATINPEGYFQDCIFDVCSYGNRDDISCRLIAGYTSACQEAGAVVYPWRSEDFCNLPCEENSHYNICTKNCPDTCRSLGASVQCSIQCQEGCACNDGYVLSAGHCVAISECGCTFDGKYYKPDETFFPEGTCEKMCSCSFGGIVTCTSFSCGQYEECRVEKGVQNCHPIGSSTCSVIGENNIYTFDNKKYEFSGNCSYILSRSCLLDGSKLTPYLIHYRNLLLNPISMTKTKIITLEVYGYNISIYFDVESQIMVNGIFQNPPFVLESGKLQADHQGVGIILRTDFGLVINSDLSIRVTVPGNYHSSTCGLCGDYNENPEDDVNPADDVVTFVETWKDLDSDPTCTTSESCTGVNQSCPLCPRKKVKALSGDDVCGLLSKKDGPFALCHEAVNPDAYFDSCIDTLCQGKGELCLILQNYATMCQGAGVEIKSWRSPSFCPIACQEHSHFSNCVDICSTSCSSLYDDSICPTSCFEGCQCDNGYLFQGRSCVLPDQCGCYVNTTYYKAYQTVVSDDCSQRCTCQANQKMLCEPYGCKVNEECVVLEGVRTCINVDPCKSVTCRNKETCQAQDGIPICVPDYTGTCLVWGAHTTKPLMTPPLNLRNLHICPK
ncbi:hypothetical protein GDO86_012141 [Hymenochirus boettgeri]|uniref:VWFD domain-containing protein n=1 Tax=Hymenochirus boettgeri TaxID=247094 RepID=A0A8T2IU30_9PIPI|nr:hypothetical protein GDO86_012141 [Hymenochirus boettgeri]